MLQRVGPRLKEQGHDVVQSLSSVGRVLGNNHSELTMIGAGVATAQAGEILRETHDGALKDSMKGMCYANSEKQFTANCSTAKLAMQSNPQHLEYVDRRMQSRIVPVLLLTLAHLCKRMGKTRSTASLSGTNPTAANRPN
jgi:hypothetical protein